MDALNKPLRVIERVGIIPILVIDDASRAAALGEALLQAGLPLVEVTLRTEAAIQAIEALAAMPDLVVGAGTVRNETAASAAVGAGARYIVSPGFSESVVGWCMSNGIDVLPGVMTPTDAMVASRAGVDTVKFFPAEAAGGVPMVRSLASVFGDMRFVPTGGIDASNAADYLRLDAVVACGGSWIVDRRLIVDGDFTEIERRARAAVELVATVRAS